MNLPHNMGYLFNKDSIKIKFFLTKIKKIAPLQSCRTMNLVRFAPSVVSGSSHVVAHMMPTGGLHGR